MGKDENPRQTPREVIPPVTLVVTFGILGAGFLLDASQGFPFFMGIVIVWVFVAVCHYLLSSAHRRCWRMPRDFRIFLVTMAVFFVLDIGAWKFGEFYTETQIEKITKACNEYKADLGKYPDRLEDLVPVYLASIPETNVWWATSHHLTYYGLPDNHWLLWYPHVFSPRTYSLERASF